MANPIIVYALVTYVVVGAAWFVMQVSTDRPAGEALASALLWPFGLARAALVALREIGPI